MICAITGAVQIFAQPKPAPAARADKPRVQEVSEEDGVPVIIKHLPEWESVRNGAKIAHTVAELKAALGERPVFDLIDFTGGTEAVSAEYAQGKLLIVEYPSPALSTELDAKVQERIAGQPIQYKRIGNYNVFVFDAPDAAAAMGLIDQVKYEKRIQWLGSNPFELERARLAERNFVNTTADIFFSTLMAIVLGLVASVFAGIAVGIIYFHRRKARRASMPTHSDAGGMTRLNLDGFTPEVSADRMVEE